MKHTLKLTALAVFAASLSTGVAAADTVSTKGGFQIKSEDGNFEAKIGGRIHFDANYYVDEDDINAGAQNTRNDFFFRRARLSLEGRAYDFTYKFENDFANSSGGAQGDSFKEMWIGKKVAKNINLRLGQAKPYRGMEELTSSNEILFMERPMSTATGIYGEQFVMGAFLDGSGENYGWGVSAYSPKSAGDTGTANASGSGIAARAYFVPVRSEGNIVHVGVSASQDKYDTRTATVRPRIVGREGGLRNTSNVANQIVEGVYENQTSTAIELAGRFGPLMVQGEYTLATFDDSADNTFTNAFGGTAAAPVTISGRPDVDVAAYNIQASFMLTDHVRPYDFKKGVFKAPKVNGEEGAWELKARFDKIENKDQANREGSYYGVGVNYYATPNTRFMLEYIDGQVNNNSATELEASAVTARAQFNF